MSRRATSVVTAAALVVSALVTGCQSAASGGGSGLRVVASTSVYGGIAAEIGGDQVSVTSIISDPSQDPHSYQADARTELTLSRADVVVQNGGGYDEFVHTMLSASNSKATVIDAVEVSGRTAPAGGELNEHVWYDIPSVRKVVGRLVTDFSAKDRAAGTSFRRNATAFTTKLEALRSTEASIKAAHAGEGIAITEPVPLYLLSACGLVNRTPAQFSKAVEEGDGVPITVLKHTLDLFRQHTVELLAYNTQSSGRETDEVLAAAKSNGVPAVGFTETMPRGQDYVSWMSANLAAVKAALV
ncbi:MAG: metal ABC transporter solute-binding protein, Zn/Mn family [Jatrophihabitans sp.]